MRHPDLPEASPHFEPEAIQMVIKTTHAVRRVDDLVAGALGHCPLGRALRLGQPREPLPEFGLYLLGEDPGPMPWPMRWLRWPDFWLPTDREAGQL